MYVVTKPDNFLLHYGVKGMHWGVRKENRSLSGSRKRLKTAAKIISPLGYAAYKGTKKGIKFGKTVRSSKSMRSAVNRYRNLSGSKASGSMKKYRSKNIDGMSDSDLKKAINRMNLERQYRDLTKLDYMRGHKYASDILRYSTTAKRFKK